jgi:GH24 family phage-related lysozyme (muramidase)
MNLSDAGLDRIKGYEGYKRRLPDGGCTAYQDIYHGKLDIPTIGWGCTEGVKMGMVWTKAEAEAALRREMAKHEAAVTRLVTVEINQHQFDALCALSYNIGTGIGAKKGGLANSSVIAKLNKGDVMGAAEAFKLYNKAGGGVVPGLASRRMSEAALFLRPMPDDHQMPQTVEASRPAITATQATIAAAPVAAGAVPVVQAVSEAIKAPALPAPPTGLLEQAGAWKGFAAEVVAFGGWIVGNPHISGPAVLLCAGWWWWSKKQEAAQ